MWHVVEDADAARVLADPKRRRYLLPFILEELSLSEAARRLNVKPNSLLYHIDRLLKLELLEVTQVKKRRGRSSKLYRASAERFFIPFSLTQADTVQGLSAENSVRLERMFQRSLIGAEMDQADDWGIAIYVMNDGGLSIDLTPSRERTAENALSLNTDRSAVWSCWLETNLGAGEAKALQRDLVVLWQRYKQVHDPDKPRYMLRLGLAPVTETELPGSKT